MLISEETYNKLNELLTESFKLNHLMDNLVYQIDYEAYPNIAKIVHESYAHVWPAFADNISDFMIRLNAKPIRNNFTAQYTDHNGDLQGIFKDITRYTEEYRGKVLETLDVAEMQDDAETKIFLEDYLLKITPYRKQANLWATFAERYVDNYKNFNIHFEKLTTAIPIVE